MTDLLKSPFFLTYEQKYRYILSRTPISIRELTKGLNDVADLTICKKLRSVQITDWLLDVGILERRRDSGGKMRAYPTPQGVAIDITAKPKIRRDVEYWTLFYGKAAQQFIIDNIDEIVSFKKR